MTDFWDNWNLKPSKRHTYEPEWLVDQLMSGIMPSSDSGDGHSRWWISQFWAELSDADFFTDAEWGNCSGDETILVPLAFRQRNGLWVKQYRCINCRLLNRKEYGGDLPGALPVHDDIDTTPCERCGGTDNGIEVHHWAPRHLFRDCERWPTARLCPPCHREWHNTINKKAATS